MELYDNIQKVLAKKNINPVVGEIYDLMAVCRQWYKGNVDDFHFYNVKLVDGTSAMMERKTLNMPKKVCEDISNLLWSERAEIKLDKSKSNKKLWDILDSKENSFTINFNTFIEKLCALGAMATIEYKKNDKTIIDYVDGDLVIPYKYTNSYIYGMITVSRTVEEVRKSKNYYTLLTYHEYEDGMYKKATELYVSKSESTLGKQIDVSVLYPNIEEDEVIETEQPRFQIWRLPIGNNYDFDSPMGLSVLANHFDKFKAIDTKYDGFDHEYVSGKRRILIDRSAVKKKATGVDDNDNIIYTSYFDTDDDVYVAIEGMENDPVKDIDFSLRAEDYIKGINAELNYLSAGVRLGNNYYSFDKTGLKTATEVISENSDTFRMKQQYQLAIYDALYDMVATICDMNDISYKEIIINFDDSIIQDEDALIQRGINLYNAGLISKSTFLKKYMHFEDNEIEEELMKIKDENKIIQPSGLDFFGTQTETEEDEEEQKEE